jgi:hypothetical protein
VAIRITPIAITQNFRLKTPGCSCLFRVKSSIRSPFFSQMGY